MTITKTFDPNSIYYATGQRNLEYNMMYVKAQQNYFNDLLQAKGHVFLNEVYSVFGIEHTRTGATHGWATKGTKRFLDILVSADIQQYDGLTLRFDVEEILDFLEEEGLE